MQAAAKLAVAAGKSFSVMRVSVPAKEAMAAVMARLKMCAAERVAAKAAVAAPRIFPVTRVIVAAKEAVAAAIR